MTTVETPWGPTQTAGEIAPGIIRYATASHRSYFISPGMCDALTEWYCTD